MLTEDSPDTEHSDAPVAVEADQVDSVRQYFREIAQAPLLTAAEEIALGHRVQAGDQSARNLLVESNLRLVVSIARKYRNRTLPFQDRIEEGNLGLIRAAELFDPDRGLRFSTYASWWIRSTMERAMMVQERLVSIPVHKIKFFSTILKAAQQLLEETGEEACVEAIAAKIGKPVKQVRQALEDNRSMVSLDAPLHAGYETDTTMLDIIMENIDETDPADDLYAREWRSRLSNGLMALSARHRNMLVLRFGIGTGDPKTHDQIGDILGVSRESVRKSVLHALSLLAARVSTG
ncbi:sigma-70 family RNA polymerase sigma factor [Acidithiobacillus ferrivorans]|nr:sigma-70 family RNA polymerase sigma factor [Acidithiobacillus ferrivorans]